MSHLDTVLTTLATNGLHIIPAKCQFAQPQVEFLGYLVTSTGIAPLTPHNQPILTFPAAPTDVK
jgi:hypothetical protein